MGRQVKLLLMNSSSFKETILSFVYLLLVIVILSLINMGLWLLFDSIIFNALDWFNSLHWAIKIVSILFGAYAIFSAFLSLCNGISQVIGYLIFKWFPLNNFTTLTALILSLLNSGYNIVKLWRAAPYYGFWMVLELILLSVFVWELSSIVIIKKDKRFAYEN